MNEGIVPEFIYISSCRRSKLSLFSHRQVSRFTLRGLGTLAIINILLAIYAVISQLRILRHWIGCIGILKKQAGFSRSRLSSQWCGFVWRPKLLVQQACAADLGFLPASSALLGPAWPGRGRGGPRLAPRAHPGVRVIQPRVHDAAQPGRVGALSRTPSRLPAGRMLRGCRTLLVACRRGPLLISRDVCTVWSVRARCACPLSRSGSGGTVLAGATC